MRNKKTVNKIYLKVLPEIRLYEAQLLNEKVINKLNSRNNKFSISYLMYIFPKKIRKEVKESYLETKSDLADIVDEMRKENQHPTYIKFIVMINIFSVIINFVYHKVKDISIQRIIN